MVNGPLIPGMREFDRPGSRWPAWASWLLGSLGVLLALVVVAGFVGGVGPLRSLGQSTTPLRPVGYRPTAVDTVLQVSVAMPPSGLCRNDEVVVVAFERSNRVEVESKVTRGRNADCPIGSMGGDTRWVDVELTSPLGERTVIRATDREPLQRDTSLGQDSGSQ